MKGPLTLHDSTKLEENPETYYNAGDNSATSNHRFIFDVPGIDPTVQLGVWNPDILSDDPLAEATLDLSDEFRLAEKTKMAVEMPRGQLKLSRPGSGSGEWEWLEMQGCLIPADEAAMRVVGKRRDDPNEDLLLDLDTRHNVKGKATTAGKMSRRSLVFGLMYFLVPSLAGTGAFALFLILLMRAT